MNLNKMEVGLWLNYGFCGGIQVDMSGVRFLKAC